MLKIPEINSLTLELNKNVNPRSLKEENGPKKKKEKKKERSQTTFLRSSSFAGFADCIVIGKLSET
jgi:hypothetical protein